jgi:hypothetical protein
MRRGLLIILILCPLASPSRGADVRRISTVDARPAWLATEPVLRRDSILHRRTNPQTAGSKRPTFALRTTVDSNRQVVRLVGDDSQDDDDAGIAYIGAGSHLEPEIAAEDLVPPLGPPPPESGVAAGSAKGDSVLIDGAAEEAEKSPKKPRSQANEYSSFAWIAGTGNQLGILEWVDRDLAVFDYTFSDRASMRINPGFAMRWLTGPDSTDLPPYLFSITLDIGFGGKLSENWSYDVVITPSWNTDFANKSFPLFRLPWQAVNTFTVTNELKLVLGVTDLDREDIQFLPVAGLIYKPLDGSQQYDLIFPRPKAAWRLTESGEDSTWAYVSGELGGNSFTIQRPNAVQDVVTLRDYRLMFGWESRSPKRHASRIEAGWVFGRAVEYNSGIGDYHPGQTAIIRYSSDY